MKALVLSSPGRLTMADMPKPSPGAGELLIKTKAATICTSDLADIRENPFGIKLPMIMGHEGAGVVEEAGSGAGFEIGDEVAAHPVMHCGKCISCKRGLFHLCDDMAHLGLNVGGAFAEYFVIRADRARKKPGKLSFAESTLMEPVCVCLEAVERANVTEKSNVLVIGDGPFGILIAKLAKKKRPTNVIVSGRHGYRLSMAGAKTVNEKTSKDAAGEIMALTGGGGIDSCIVCAANGEAVETGISVLRSRGTLCLFSGHSGRTPVDLFKVHVKELNITGSCNDAGFLDEALDLLSDGRLGLGKVITHTFPFEDCEKAFRQAEYGKDSGLKVSLEI